MTYREPPENVSALYISPGEQVYVDMSKVSHAIWRDREEVSQHEQRGKWKRRLDVYFDAISGGLHLYDEAGIAFARAFAAYCEAKKP